MMFNRSGESNILISFLILEGKAFSLWPLKYDASFVFLYILGFENYMVSVAITQLWCRSPEPIIDNNT